MPSFKLILALALMLPILANPAHAALSSGEEDLHGESDKPAPRASEAKIDYKYVTRQEVVLKGLVLRGDAQDGDEIDVLPQEVILPANSVFRMEDRTDDGQGNKFVKIGIESGDDLNSIMSYWVNEGDLVEALYEVRGSENSDYSLDKMDGRDAKFSYGSSYAVAGPNQFMMPVMNARKSSPPGFRVHPILHTRRLHAGWDLAAPGGTPVMAAADGVVEKAGWSGGYGNLITIRHGKLQTRYGHLSKILVKERQSVKRGDVIGKVGTTGLSTGNHLHFEQRDARGAVIFDRPNEQMLAEFKSGKTQLAAAKPVAAPTPAPVTVAVLKAPVKKILVSAPDAAVKPAPKASPVVAKKKEEPKANKQIGKKKQRVKPRAKPQPKAFNLFDPGSWK